MSVPARAVAALAVPAAFSLLFGSVPEMKQCVVLPRRPDDNVPAASAVAAAGTSVRREFLPAERHAAVTAVAGLDPDLGFVDKHEPLR